MLQIVYISRASIDFSDHQIDALAEQSASRNASADVTGLLLYDGSRFIQAIEGARSSVIDTMSRISNDHRHDAIIALPQTPITVRQFGTWSMRFKDVRSTREHGFTEKVKADISKVSDASLRAAFIGFAILGSRL